jgi:hypothetical protein
VVLDELQERHIPTSWLKDVRKGHWATVDNNRPVIAPQQHNSFLYNTRHATTGDRGDQTRCSDGSSDVSPRAGPHCSLPPRTACIHAIGRAGARSRRLAHGSARTDEAH